MYATDGHTDGPTGKSNAYCPFPMGGGIIGYYRLEAMFRSVRNGWSNRKVFDLI